VLAVGDRNEQSLAIVERTEDRIRLSTLEGVLLAFLRMMLGEFSSTRRRRAGSPPKHGEGLDSFHGGRRRRIPGQLQPNLAHYLPPREYQGLPACLLDEQEPN
jgi:hypothetical protein